MIKYSTLPQNNAFTPDLAVLVRVLATTPNASFWPPDESSTARTAANRIAAISHRASAVVRLYVALVWKVREDTF
jgi:hypothetical protein